RPARPDPGRGRAAARDRHRRAGGTHGPAPHRAQRRGGHPGDAAVRPAGPCGPAGEPPARRGRPRPPGRADPPGHVAVGPVQHDPPAGRRRGLGCGTRPTDRRDPRGGGPMSTAEESMLPRVPVGDWIDTAFDWIDDNLNVLLTLFRDVMTFVVEGLVDLLMWPPPLVMVALFALVAWLVASWRLALGTALGFALLISMDIWLPSMQTLALVIVATIV